MSDEKVFGSGIPSSPGEAGVMCSEEVSEAQKIKNGICPSCGGSLVFQEGCKVCYGCGWGGCG
jgi:hypothetical protein